MTILLPVRIVSVANLREHWRVKHQRTSAHRFGAKMLCKSAGAMLHEKTVVTMIRIAPRSLDDDNLASAFKAVRDGIADALGIDDRDKRVEWRYGQERGKAGEYAARIEIKANGPS